MYYHYASFLFVLFWITLGFVVVISVNRVPPYNLKTFSDLFRLQLLICTFQNKVIIVSAKKHRTINTSGYPTSFKVLQSHLQENRHGFEGGEGVV